ncbi:MAG: LCP family protein [Acidimicrobiales bacterium]
MARDIEDGEGAEKPGDLSSDDSGRDSADPGGPDGPLGPGESQPGKSLPGESGPGGSGPGSHRKLRRWPRRVLIGANIVVLVVLVAAAGGYGYLRYKLGQIKHVTVANLTSPGVAPSAPENILLVGSDSRVGEGGKFGGTAQVAGQRSDTIILVHLDPATGKAAMLSIPRDTLVNVVDSAPYNGTNKINTSYEKGPSGLVATIHAAFGIAINHVIQVNFSGLSGVTNAVGGVCMSFPYPTRDGSPTGNGNESGLDEPAGNDTLNGIQALSLVRSRYYQYEVNGSWMAEGTGDLGRIKRQHEFLQVLASKAIKSGIENPLKANALISDLVKDVTVDQALSPSDILGLVGQFHSLRPSNVPSFTLPTNSVLNYESFGDVLLPIKSADAKIISDWQSGNTPGAPAAKPATKANAAPTTTTTLVPSEVSVAVLNGSGAPNEAGQAASGLTSAGFNVVSTGDAPSFTNTASTVTYGPGLESAAAVVAEHIEGGANLSEDSTMTGSTVSLITGSTFRGISAKAMPGSVTTTPTPSTTTTTIAPTVAAADSAPGQSSYPSWDPTPCTG